MDKILPVVLNSEENKQKFADFIKISYNESKKNNNVNSKHFLKLI